MKDFTQGSIFSHIIAQSVPLAISMLGQIAFYVVDLYFISQQGGNAIAGVGIAGNIVFLVIAISQIIYVGTSASISRKIGAKQISIAQVYFAQSVSVSLFFAIIALLVICLLSMPYFSWTSANNEIAENAFAYTLWALPYLLSQFKMASMKAGLRSLGTVKAMTQVQIIAIVINIILCPVLISGWITGISLGVVGAGLSTSIATIVGLVLTIKLFHSGKLGPPSTNEILQLKYPIYRKILKIGTPAGAEYFLMFIFSAFTYFAIKDFSGEVQSAYNIGSRIVQCMFLPVAAIAFAIPSIVGQNLGAKNYLRIKSTFKISLLINCLFMLTATVVCISVPMLFTNIFSPDAGVLEASIIYLQITALDFVPFAIIFTCTGLFNGLGETKASLKGVISRLFTFLVPAYWLTNQSWYEVEFLWYLSVFAILFQSLLSIYLVKRTLSTF